MDMIKTQKHSIAKKGSSLLLLVMVLVTFLPLSFIVKAATDESVERIYDYANTLSNSEKEDLEELAASYYQDTGNNYLIVTTTTREEYDYSHSSSPEEDCELYSKAFYDSFIELYGEAHKNCTILTVDLSSESSNRRYANISGQSELETKLNDERCTKAFSEIKSSLHDSDYANAYTKYMKVVNRYQKIKPNLNPDSIFLKIWFQLLISVIIGGITIGVMLYHSGGKMTASGQTYLDRERSSLVRRHDHYIRTHTTRTKRKTDSDSSSSGGSSGSSGSGSNGGGYF